MRHTEAGYETCLNHENSTHLARLGCVIARADRTGNGSIQQSDPGCGRCAIHRLHRRRTRRGMDRAALGGSDAATLQPLFPTTTFRTSSAAAQGYVNAVTVTVPGVDVGGTAFFKMAVYNGVDFASSALKGRRRQSVSAGWAAALSRLRRWSDCRGLPAPSPPPSAWSRSPEGRWCCCRAVDALFRERLTSLLAGPWPTPIHVRVPRVFPTDASRFTCLPQQ